MPESRRLGADAEDRAADFLMGLGLTIVTRRFKARHGELDLVALDGDRLVFVEVKERLTGAIPEEAIGRTKIGRLVRAANQYVADTEQAHRESRFDVVAIDRDGLRHYRDVLSG
ncbi:MAG TPA: YraN family protein [Fimbriimonas sp.]